MCMISLSKHIIYLHNPFKTGKVWHKVNFKLNTTRLNSGFSFLTSSHAKGNVSSFLCYLAEAGKKIWIHAFSLGISKI